MFWSKLCKPSWNCAWNLAFPVFISPIAWNMLPWVPEVFLACGGTFQCWPKAEATSGEAGRYKDLTETGNYARKVSGTQGRNMCENLHYESVYFKELHNEQEYYWPTIYRTGAAVVSTITSYSTRTLSSNSWHVAGISQVNKAYKEKLSSNGLDK